MNNELKHFGVLGMKWGIRRYQNKDGTRTSLAKRRSKEEPGGLKGIIKRKEESRSVENRAKKYKNLSDEMAYKVAKGEQAASRYLAYTGGTLMAQTVVPTFMKYQNKKTISFDHVGDKVFTADNLKRVAVGGLINVSYLTLRDAHRKRKQEKKSMKNTSDKKFPLAKREDVRNQKLQKRATQLKSKFGDEYKVEVKDNKIMVDNGIDKWVVY